MYVCRHGPRQHTGTRTHITSTSLGALHTGIVCMYVHGWRRVCAQRHSIFPGSESWSPQLPASRSAAGRSGALLFMRHHIPIGCRGAIACTWSFTGPKPSTQVAETWRQSGSETGCRRSTAGGGGGGGGGEGGGAVAAETTAAADAPFGFGVFCLSLCFSLSLFPAQDLVYHIPPGHRLEGRSSMVDARCSSGPG